MTRPSQLENGITLDALAVSAARVYFICMSGQTSHTVDRSRVAEVADNPGWLNLAAVAFSMYAASDTHSIPFKVAELADQFRRAHSRGLNGDDPAASFESLPVRERLAWEMVARHSCWMTQGDEDRELMGLPGVEAQWGDRMASFAQQRGLTLEQPREFDG